MEIKILPGITAKRVIGELLVGIVTLKYIINGIARRYIFKEPAFLSLVENYDVVIMKHCSPASDILEDVGKPDPSSPRKSLENYKAIYRLLRDEFDKHDDTLFIVWTLPPRHRLFEPSDGDKCTNAARATEFSKWLKTDFPTEAGDHPNICIWDLREIVMDPDNNFLKYEYESEHNTPDSHPNKVANNDAGTQLAEFVVDSVANFYGNSRVGRGAKIVFLHHSVGLGVYEYPDMGVPAWLSKYNAARGVNHVISHRWYPWDGNMPEHYYRRWLSDNNLGN